MRKSGFVTYCVVMFSCFSCLCFLLLLLSLGDWIVDIIVVDATREDLIHFHS